MIVSTLAWVLRRWLLHPFGLFSQRHIGVRELPEFPAHDGIGGLFGSLERSKRSQSKSVAIGHFRVLYGLRKGRNPPTLLAFQEPYAESDKPHGRLRSSASLNNRAGSVRAAGAGQASPHRCSCWILLRASCRGTMTRVGGRPLNSAYHGRWSKCRLLANCLRFAL